MSASPPIATKLMRRNEVTLCAISGCEHTQQKNSVTSSAPHIASKSQFVDCQRNNFTLCRRVIVFVVALPDTLLDGEICLPPVRLAGVLLLQICRWGAGDRGAFSECRRSEPESAHQYAQISRGSAAGVLGSAAD